MALWLAVAFVAAALLCAEAACSAVMSLDGEAWLIATDPKNAGREEQWWQAPRADAKQTKVPWIIQDPFPGYHGVAWYWRDFVAPANPHSGGRCLLRFWAVDYQAQVWLNGAALGTHEGGETPFVFDATDAIKPGQTNRLAVRVLNPTHEPIDGIVLNQTPHRNKALPYSAGSAWDQGGIIDSVELLVAPALRVEDLFARADLETGVIRLRLQARNAAAQSVAGRLELSVAPAASGETLAGSRLEREFPPGETTVETELRVEQPRLWDLNDPFLYRVTARLWADGSPSWDEQSARCGFRDFRFKDGCFRLNGRRIFLRCSHTGNCCPVGLELPHDPDLLRRDLLNVKVMGFNAIRFIAGLAKRYQLDLCDEIGLMVYEECYAGWCLADSPKMQERFTQSVLDMVRRDRNHPSVVMWGLLNETPDGPVFRAAVGSLKQVRALDDSRLVMLNSGRWDAQGGSVAGLEAWREGERTDPCVTRNGTTRVIKALGITWALGQLSFHPGQRGEYALVRWTAPAAETVEFAASFKSIAERATTDVHLLHNGRPLFDGFINVRGGGPQAQFQTNLPVKAGDVVDCAVGFGNGDYGADTTALAVTFKGASGKVHDAAADFSAQHNPNGVWSYGQLPPGPGPDTAKFARFATGVTMESVGSLANPGSSVWEDVLSDQHPYQRVPHTADIVQRLRTLSGGHLPVFVSEYGIGSAVDLVRAARHYERLGKTAVEDAQFYRDKLERFLADWERWRMAEAFGRPEDFFAESLKRMAGQRLLGINAIRANPGAVGYSLTGTVDQGMTGEGLFTTFRELKPGTVDAVFDGWAPLRWCLFVEPVNVYRGARVRLEGVLANEDALAAGQYPVKFQVVGPGQQVVWSRQTNVAIIGRGVKPEPPFAFAVLAEEAAVDWPAGKYRFVAHFERGGAAAGGEAEFYVADQADLPRAQTEVLTWGEDALLDKWLSARGIAHRVFDPVEQRGREVILAALKPPGPGGAEVFTHLARHVARGSTAVFLAPEVFAKEGNPVGWAPLARKGAVRGLPSWLYHKDEWAKPHPIFAGLPTGLLDYTFYRELIPDAAWTDLDPPAEAVCGANDASVAYSSGLMVSVHTLGAGRFVLNTLRVREHLGQHPAADRLLLNLLHFAASEQAKPLAELPADFESQLRALDYR